MKRKLRGVDAERHTPGLGVLCTRDCWSIHLPFSWLKNNLVCTRDPEPKAKKLGLQLLLVGIDRRF